MDPAFFCFVSSSAWSADGVTVNLDSVKIYDLVKVVYGDSLQAGYAVDADLINDPNIVALDVRNLPKPELKKLLDTLLQERGYTVKKTGSFFRVKKAGQGETVQDEPFYYKPKHRSVSYIAEMTQGLFKTGRFTFQSSGQNVRPTTDAPQVNAPEASSTSVYGQSQKNHDAFVFQGTAADVDLLRQLLAQIDTPVGEVMVKAYLYEVTRTEKEGSGFNAAVNLIDGKFGLKLAGSALANSLTIALPNIQAVFSALESDNRFKVISAPSLRVQDGGKARFSVGADVPVLGAVTTNQSGLATQSVTYKNSGTILYISPTIRDKQIDLEVLQQVSNFIPTTTGVNNSPTLIKRELSSRISARDGDLILMGGLDESKNTQEGTGLSWLPAIFHNLTAEHSKSDILLVLHVQRL